MRKTVQAAAAAALLAMPAAGDVAVTGGVVRGETLSDGTMIFRSIPFAAPPVGNYRWRPPQPVAPWPGVRDVSRTAPPCYQRSYDWNAADAYNGREDCLYIAVQVPPHAAGARLPVMAWIHGGANRAGDGHDIIESPITHGGVILVSIQYRLGIFGFLSMAPLTAESGQHASGNYGLMDQIAGLKWVKANIANFGGDPANLTIFGESAGGQDVGLLMLSPLARGLFHKAIAESGTAGFGVPPRSLAENERIGADLAMRMGVRPDAAGLVMLRLASPEALLNATDRLLPPPSVDPTFIWLQAVVDGHVLPGTPAQILNAGQQARVPLLIGSNLREFTVAGARDYPRRWIEENAGRNGEALAALYAGEPAFDPLQGSLADRLSNDVIFRCPANWVASRQAAVTNQVWRYQMSVAAPDTVQPIVHAGELKYVFQKIPAGASVGAWPPLAAYWVNFARSGDPNGPGLPQWPAYGREERYIDFTPEGARTGVGWRAAFCRLLDAP